MANKYKMKRGDSLWLDVVPTEAIDSIDATWPGTWSAKWNVKVALTDETPVAEGDCILFDGLAGRPDTPGKFRAVIDSVPTDATPIPNGNYIITIEVYNGLTTFRKEVAQDKLVVGQEGLPYVA
jgi:hypothetical protein